MKHSSAGRQVLSRRLAIHPATCLIHLSCGERYRNGEPFPTSQTFPIPSKLYIRCRRNTISADVYDRKSQIQPFPLVRTAYVLGLPSSKVAL